MELTEKIETINSQLIDSYGVDTVTGQAMWRIAWSEDQFEHRHDTYTDYVPGTDIFLRTVTETRYVPKYSQWIKEKYVLERLVLIPEINLGDLPASKMSYEPMYPFQTDSGAYAPPSILACRFIIDGVLAAQGRGNLKKYLEKEANMSKEDWYEMKNQEIKTLQDELFGNETDTGDALAHGDAIIVPRNYERES
jgi:hypothetical protein